MTSADAIPRYEIPVQAYEDYDEPETGACWNCDHMVEVKIHGKTHPLCVLNRDEYGSGEVYLAHANMRDCPDWVES